MLEKINSTTYKAKHGKYGEVEIGNKDAFEFKPHLKLKKWGEECTLNVSLPDEVEEVTEKQPKISEQTTSEEEDIIKEHHTPAEIEAQHSNRKTRFYQKPPREFTEIDNDGNEHTIKQLEDGGFEFEVVLDEKPASNIIEFDINTQDLDFFYQPELTQEEKDNGAFRPENVIGSYAVYHSSKNNMHSSQEEAEKYKTGKAFHIYRPKVTDAEGNEVWGELNIDEQSGKLTVTIPQSFLDNAVYPVSIDPTFGYETEGGSTKRIIDTISGSWFNLDEPADISEITSYIEYSGPATQYYKNAIYDKSDASLEGVSEETSGYDPGMSYISKWITHTISLTISTGDYYLVGWADGGFLNLYYDSSTDKGSYQDKTYNNFPDPWSPTTENKKYSIYATYTISTSSPTVTTESATNVDFNSATLNGSLDDDGGETCDVYFEWGTDTNYGNTTSTQTANTGDGFSDNISGLNGGTTYHFRAVATNSAGTDYGSDVTFTPPNYIISGTVTKEGSVVDGAKITLINDTDNTIVGTTTTDTNGDYSFEELNNNKTYHIIAQYDDGTTKYNAESKPYLTPVEA